MLQMLRVDHAARHGMDEGLFVPYNSAKRPPTQQDLAIYADQGSGEQVEEAVLN